MNPLVNAVYKSLIDAGHTEQTITPKLVFDGIRAEAARLKASGTLHPTFPSIFARDATELARIEKAVGGRLTSLDIGEAMVTSFHRELTYWWTPDLENTAWLSQELSLAAKARGGRFTVDDLVDDLVGLRETLRIRASEHPRLSGMTDEGIVALATHAHAHMRDVEAWRVPIELAETIESIWRFGTTLDQPITAPARLTWLETRLMGPNPDHAPEVHSSIALPVKARVDENAVGAFVHHGLHHKADLDKAVVQTLGAEARAAYFARVRDVNNVLFTQSCIDLGANIAAAAQRPREPIALHTAAYATLDTKGFVTGGHNAPTMQALAKASAAHQAAIDSAPTCIMTVDDARADGLAGNGAFYVRLPVGELGEPLARALMTATEIARREAVALAEAITNDASFEKVDAVIQSTTLLHAFDKILVEGVVSIAQSIALLLAKRPAPPYDTPDAALRLIDESRLVTQLAGMAPFGIIAPMAATGAVPGEPISVVQKSSGMRAQLPADFETMLHEVHASRIEHLHHGNLFDWVSSDHRSETGRGCPVAGRGPVLGPDGKLELAKDAGLSVLTHHFIELTRKLL